MEQAIPRLADEALDFQALQELVAHSSSSGWGVELICLIGITGCWLAAVVHAYVVGRKINSHL
jgi:hypothetical protein